MVKLLPVSDQVVLQQRDQAQRAFAQRVVLSGLTEHPHGAKNVEDVEEEVDAEKAADQVDKLEHHVLDKHGEKVEEDEDDDDDGGHQSEHAQSRTLKPGSKHRYNQNLN